MLMISLSTNSLTQPSDLYHDISLNTNKDYILFGNKFIHIAINKKTGEWQKLNGFGNTIFTSESAAAMDVKVDGKMLLNERTSHFINFKTTINKSDNSVSLHTIVKLSNEYELITTYILFSGKALMERCASITYMNGNAIDNRNFEGFFFTIPNLAPGNNKDCFINVPGPFWPATFTPPNTPYDSLKNKTIHYHSAPDGSFGIFSISNNKLKTCFTSWMKTGKSTFYNTSINGNGKSFSLLHKDNKGQYLQPGNRVVSDTQQIIITRDFTAALNAYKKMASLRMPLNAGTPSWVKEAVILEVLPEYFKGGIKELTTKLPFYKNIGFNTIYLMPHWKGGYSPVDLYKINEKYGTEEDLKEMVKIAHGLNMRVLFDMVIHGFNTTSPVVLKHREFFYRDKNDSLMIHPAWGSVMTDFMNPSYQQYMKDYVVYDQQTFDNDGYRIDAASFKGTNWRKDITYPGFESGTSSPLLMKMMLDTLQKKNSNVAFLSEVFGPVFYTVCNFVHDNQTEAMSFVIKKINEGNYHISQYKKHISYVYRALPKGAVRVFYTRNHDTSWFYEFYGYSPLFMSIEAIHALFGIPEVFAGDPNYKFNPDDDSSTFEQYRKLFSTRSRFPEFIHGEKLLDEVSCDNQDVFTGAAKDNKHGSLAVISSSAKSLKTNISLPSHLVHKKIVYAENIITSEKRTLKISKDYRLSLFLKPFDVWIIRLH